MNSKVASLKRRLDAGEFIVAPGVFELISARIADTMDVPALYMTGYGTVASYLGLPDAGLASYADMLNRVTAIAGATSKPLIADGDTGYGGLLNVDHAVRGYEQAGAAAIQLEDQEFPKKCGHTPGRRVIPLDDMVRKIKVAVAARQSSDFLIVARTDARTNYGLEEALQRGRAFEEAGADVIFIESPETPDEMQAICRAIEKPKLVNVVDGGSTPVLPLADLEAIGYNMAIFPATGFLAMGAALRSAYQHIADTGSSAGLQTPIDDFMSFSRLMGFEDIWSFEKKWPERSD
ncbi:MAG: isocitrate lyase/PEP mutase family protein [Burkholderiaceae bacterium]